MSNRLKTLSEVWVGCATMPSQRTYETCMTMAHTPYTQRISESVVDEAFEGYKNQNHAAVSYFLKFLNEGQKEMIKQGISIKMEKQKEMAKSFLRLKGLLM